MAVIPIRIEPEEIHIRADRRLAFQVVTAFGAEQGEHGASAKVLETEGDRMLVEFNTQVKLLFGMTRVFRTVEWVTLDEPERIDFSLVPGKGPVTGGLKLLEDRFILEDDAGCTDLRYESSFGIRWSIWGWVIGKLWVERYLKRHMREHLATLKETIEARAKRSRLYALECDH